MEVRRKLTKVAPTDARIISIGSQILAVFFRNNERFLSENDSIFINQRGQMPPSPTSGQESINNAAGMEHNHMGLHDLKNYRNDLILNLIIGYAQVF